MSRFPEEPLTYGPIEERMGRLTTMVTTEIFDMLRSDRMSKGEVKIETAALCLLLSALVDDFVTGLLNTKTTAYKAIDQLASEHHFKGFGN